MSRTPCLTQYALPYYLCQYSPQIFTWTCSPHPRGLHGDISCLSWLYLMCLKFRELSTDTRQRHNDYFNVYTCQLYHVSLVRQPLLMFSSCGAIFPASVCGQQSLLHLRLGAFISRINVLLQITWLSVERRSLITWKQFFPFSSWF